MTISVFSTRIFDSGSKIYMWIDNETLQNIHYAVGVMVMHDLLWIDNETLQIYIMQ